MWEPYEVKAQTIKTAVESATLLLRIDDIVSGLAKRDKLAPGQSSMAPQQEDPDAVRPCCVDCATRLRLCLVARLPVGCLLRSSASSCACVNYMQAGFSCMLRTCILLIYPPLVHAVCRWTRSR